MLAASTAVAISGAAQRASDVPVTLSFPVTRTGDTSYPLAVSYHTIDGSAVAGTDYVGAVGTVVLPAGASSGAIPITLQARPTTSTSLDFHVQIDGGTGIGPDPAFTSPRNFAGGMGSFFAVAADVNGDGNADLIVANQYGNSVSVLLDTTNSASVLASFSSKVDFPVGASPEGVAVADINGDGKPDLIAANFYGSSVSVLLNVTAPGAAVPAFAVQQVFAAGTNPQSVVALDVNGDGKPDIAVTNNDGSVSVLLNTSAPGTAAVSFAAAENYGVGPGPVSIGAADIDGDGEPDLVTTNYGGSVSVLLNRTPSGASTSTFAAQQAFSAGSYPYGLALVDINGDGKRDVVVANTVGGTATVLLNITPAGADQASFGAPQSFATGSGSLAVSAADLNGDGKPDLLVANQNTSLSVLVNTTVPGSSVPSFSAPHVVTDPRMNPEYVTAADVNGDGRPDVIVANLQSDTVSVLINSSLIPSAALDLTPTQAFAAGSGTNFVTAADLNNDGRPDLITTNLYDGTASILVNSSLPGETATFTPISALPCGNDPSFAKAADLNGDGKLDLIVSNYGSGMITAYLNTTPSGNMLPTFGPKQTFLVGVSPDGIDVADVNLDGKPDLIVGDSASGYVSVLLNATTPGSAAATFAPAQSFTAGSAPGTVRAADLNGDGKPDLIALDASTNSVGVLLNTSAPGAATLSFTPASSFASAALPQGLAVADMNADGAPDVLVAASAGNAVSILGNTTLPGATTAQFTSQQSFGAGQYPVAVAAVDMNGDGRPDAVLGDNSDGSVSVLVNRTAGGVATFDFDAPQSYVFPPGVLSIVSADVNGDGKPDLIAVAAAGSKAYVRLNAQLLATVASAPATGTILPERIFADGFE